MIFNRCICAYNITSQVLATTEFPGYNDVNFNENKKKSVVEN